MNPTIRDKVQVSLPSDSMVRVERDFKAPRALVWRAHVEPELFLRWIGGYPGWSMPLCEMDVRPGGRFRWRWRFDEDGKEFGFHGEYQVVDAPETLVNTEYFDPGTLGGEMPEEPANVRTTFTEKDGVTTLVVLMDYGSKEARDGAIATGMTDGMEVSYAQLDALVAEQQGT